MILVGIFAPVTMSPREIGAHVALLQNSVRGDSMLRLHIGPTQMHPYRRSCLTLSGNGSVGWQANRFSCWVNKKSRPSNCLHSKFLQIMWHIEKFLAILDWFLDLENSWGKTSVAHSQVNSQSWHARVLNWATRENKLELTQYGKILYWASSTARIFSRIAQLRTLAWQLWKFTRKYTLPRRRYFSIVFFFMYSFVRSLIMDHIER